MKSRWKTSKFENLYPEYNRYIVNLVLKVIRLNLHAYCLAICFQHTVKLEEVQLNKAAEATSYY